MRGRWVDGLTWSIRARKEQSSVGAMRRQEWEMEGEKHQTGRLVRATNHGSVSRRTRFRVSRGEATRRTSVCLPVCRTVGRPAGRETRASSRRRRWWTTRLLAAGCCRASRRQDELAESGSSFGQQGALFGGIEVEVAARRAWEGVGRRPRATWLLPQPKPGLTTFSLESVSWLECGPLAALVCSLQRPNVILTSPRRPGLAWAQ
ncbi:hypothetical protein B0T22DRAFT_147286 [Podospora appendiculata]|uniref:Uncharacterized protein n=1 Tax=Podospora appendiculata TaxID=314037 RepID=A0AAE1CC70_9PEZI|nr:hypothetical protein B0T22DRAFT_147286 [Podospora appendiculata]